MSIAVLGAGVIGLTTAITLRERGYDATIYTNSENENELASHAACALWMPFLMCDDEVSESHEADSRYWAEESWAKFSQILLLKEETGVFKVHHEEVWRNRPKTPYYRDIVEEFTESEIDFDDYCHKWEMTTYVIDMSLYMPWLRNRYIALGGTIKYIEKLKSLGDIGIQEGVIFNCTGLGSRVLMDDRDLRPVKGHLLLYDKVQTRYSFGDNEYCIIPRKHSLAIGSLLLDEPDIDPNKEGIDHLLHKTKQLLSSGLDKKYGVEQTTNRTYTLITGLRPYRSSGVQISRSEVEHKHVYHNYGHGGSGVTFSWGCASDCVKHFEINSLSLLNIINVHRPKDVVDISIEISHIELDRVTGEIEGVANEIMEKSFRIAKSLKSKLMLKDYSFNTVVLIDDKKYSRSTSSRKQQVIENVLARLMRDGVDYVVFESELEPYSRDILPLIHSRYRRDFDIHKKHASTGCTEDIVIWYSLRLGIINHNDNLFKEYSRYKQHKRPPFNANRLISILPSSLRNVEARAEQRICKSFGNEVGALCGKIYFDLSGKYSY